MSQQPTSGGVESDSQALPAVPTHGFRHRDTPIPFMVLWPTGYRGRHAALTALFGVARPLITMWATGARSMPQWAREILKTELKRQIAERQHVLDILEGR